MSDKAAPVFVFGCLSCGKTVSGNERSCPRCGASFEDVSFECPFCGELIVSGQRRCGSCGTEFSVFADEVAGRSSIDLDGEGDEPKSDSSSSVEFECPACGRAVSENDTKCPHCGAMFSE